MLIRKPSDIAPSDITPQSVYVRRRDFLRQAVALGLLAPLLPEEAQASTAAKLPGRPGPFSTSEKPTPYKDVTAYNNFYEFGTSKSDPAEYARTLRTRPWTVAVEGEALKPRSFDIDELLKLAAMEERTYRHRCVEAWSMAIAWSGFPLAKLVAFAKPLGSAKFVRMETFSNPKIAPGQRMTWFPWPYVEGLTMAEATNELAFLATGAYGHPMAKQHGAPIRLAVPWKYGFKSIKSIVKFSFVEQRPKGYWEELQASEYGFWANVNPEVPHPRWSQADEEVIGTGERRPTLLFNGYGEYVADLYKGLQGERLWA